MTLRWIIGSFALVFIALCGLAAFVLQENLVLYFLNPRTPYETYSPPPVPDYADEDSWAQLPAAPVENPDRPAVFYVHSTTFASRNDWNSPVEDATARDLVMRTTLPNEAGPFTEAGDVYAPFYRQATLYAFFTQKHQGRESRKTAYQDVSAAFGNFLQRAGPDRPVYLVGYGQGGLHVQRLLMDYFQDDEALRRRLVAAYIVDHATPLDLFNYALANTSPCVDETDVRCIVSWTAYSKRHDREMWRTRERQLVWDADGELSAAEDRALLCTNPVTWGIDDATEDRSRHLGAASATGMPFGEQPVLVEKAVSVSCEDGIAVVSVPKKGWLKRPRWFGQQWAPIDYNLFYEDVRRNALARLRTLEQIRETEATLAPPMAAPVDLEESPINKVPDM